ncbi:unnamed protein product [Schistocephalus solidus]|uniref:SEC63 domain-containing protein n=1 Tax=Schistocephalus solidus TaxID=70667 RepID=A0A183SDX2_SCHSO|nr:unnamed protein product [Schistocephalus solidus]
MSEHFLGYSTVASFLQLSGYEKMNELISFVAKCREFGDISLRQQEKYLLNRLNKSSGLQKLRYPVPGSVSSPEAKISILLQAQLNDHILLDSTIQADANKIMICFIRTVIGLRSIVLLDEEQIQRTVKTFDENSLIEEFEERMEKNGFSCLIDIVELCKAVFYKLWPDHPLASIRQLPGIGKDFADRLASAGITSIAGIEKSGPRKIEEVLSRVRPFGDNIYEAALKVPKYELAVEQVLTNTPEVLSFNFVIRLVRSCGFDQAAFIVGDDKNRILLKRKITTSEIEAAGEWSQVVSIQRKSESLRLFVSLLSLNFCGPDDVMDCASLGMNFRGSRPYQLNPFLSSTTEAANRRSKNNFHVLTNCFKPGLGLTPSSTSPIGYRSRIKGSNTKLVRNHSRPPQNPSSFQYGTDSSFNKIKTPLIQTKIQNFFRKTKSFSEETPLHPSTDNKVPVKSSAELITPQTTLFRPPHSCEAKIHGLLGPDHPPQPVKRFKWDPRKVKHSTPNEKARGALLGSPTSEQVGKAVMNRTFGALLSSPPPLSSDGMERQPPLHTPFNLCYSADKIAHSTATLELSPRLALDISPIRPLDTEEGTELSTIENSESQHVSTPVASIKLTDMHSERQLSCSFAEPFPVKDCKEPGLNTLTLADSHKATHNCSGLEAVDSNNTYQSPPFAELKEDFLCHRGSTNANFAADIRSDGERRHSLIVNCHTSLDNSVASNSPHRPSTVDLDNFPVASCSRLPINTPTDQGKFSKKVSFGSLCNLRALTPGAKNPKTTDIDVGYGSEPMISLLQTKPSMPCPTSEIEETKNPKPGTSHSETTRKPMMAARSTDSDCLEENQLTTRDFDLICSGWEELATFICCYNILKDLSCDESLFVTMSAPRTPPPTPTYGDSVHGHSCLTVDSINTQVPCLSAAVNLSFN